MTGLEKQRIIEMRKMKSSYAQIAADTGISVNTVKTFCRRSGLTGKDLAQTATCRNCGQPMRMGKYRPRLFCSDRCRMAWWYAHPERIGRKVFYTFECLCCGKAFEVYGNDHRKYCSQSCYNSARRSTGEAQ